MSLGSSRGRGDRTIAGGARRLGGQHRTSRDRPGTRSHRQGHSVGCRRIQPRIRCSSSRRRSHRGYPRRTTRVRHRHSGIRLCECRRRTCTNRICTHRRPHRAGCGRGGSLSCHLHAVDNYVPRRAHSNTSTSSVDGRQRRRRRSREHRRWRVDRVRLVAFGAADQSTDRYYGTGVGISVRSTTVPLHATIRRLAGCRAGCGRTGWMHPRCQRTRRRRLDRGVHGSRATQARRHRRLRQRRLCRRLLPPGAVGARRRPCVLGRRCRYRP